MALTHGVATIGVGKDYATIAAWKMAIGVGSLSGDLELLIYDSTADNIGSAFFLASRTLTFRGVVPNNGNPNTGTTIQYPLGGTLGSSTPSSGGSVIVRDLHCVGVGDDELYLGNHHGSGDCTVNVYNCIFDDSVVYFQGDVGISAKFHDNKMYNSLLRITGAGDDDFQIYNNSIDAGGNTFGIAPFVTPLSGVFTNNVVFNTSSSDILASAGTTAKGYNNRTEDMTAETALWVDQSGNLGGITPASVFASTTFADDDWLFLLHEIIRTFEAEAVPLAGRAPLEVGFSADLEYTEPSNEMINAGIPVGAPAQDIAGISRPNETGGYTIGAHEASVVGGP